MARRRTNRCAWIALLCTLFLGVGGGVAQAAKPRSAIASVLDKLYAQGAIDQATYDTDRAIHAGVKSTIKRLTGAQYMVMDADVPAVESDGKTDFHYGNDPSGLYAPIKVDRVLRDGDEVRLGDAVLVAHLTPGHTKGTTWSMKVQEAGKTHNGVIVGSRT